MTDAEREVKKKHAKSSGKSVSKMKSGDKGRTGVTQPSKAVPPSNEEAKLKAETTGVSIEIGKKLACIMKLETDKRKRAKTEKDDSPPSWFKKYMQEVRH
jgi:hypothetical protein